MKDLVTRQNERSWAISIISDINQMLSQGNLKIKRAGGEMTISSERKTMFPDVILYGDDDQSNILQGWELKLPDTPITDVTFINDAQRKATALGLNSYFIWNFTSGVLYVKDAADVFRIKKSWSQTNHVKSRADVDKYKVDWMLLIDKILIDINEFLLNGEIKQVKFEKVASNILVSSIVTRNQTNIADYLRNKRKTNARFGAYISVWWESVKSEYISDEKDELSAYAKVILVNWTNRFLFAHLIKAHHNIAYRVEEIDGILTPEQANDIFGDITRQCDFFNIFSPIDFSDYIDSESWSDLVDFNLFLCENSFSKINQESLQSILEMTVDTSQRELAGQFTTPPRLAEILTRITMLNAESESFDPCCGTGTIAKAICKHKKTVLSNVEKSVETTWASDKFSFPLQIASISLTDIDTINMASRVFQKNLLDIKIGDVVSITNPKDGSIMPLAIPTYGTVISNLPFIPFEIIDTADIEHIENIRENVKSNCGIELSRKADYYSYLFFAIWELLEARGRAGFLTSNSWLGTDAGLKFYQALGHYYDIEQVHISGSGRWFKNADVVSVAIVLTKKSVISVPKDTHKTIFAIWNKSIEELESDEIRDSLINSSLLQKEHDANILSMSSYSQNTIDQFLSMGMSINAIFHQISWLIEIKESLCPFSDVLSVTRGERRGWDKMFYPEEGHGIEPEYIKKILKTARSISKLNAKPDHDAFCCSLSKAELSKQGHTGALRWIEKFEQGVNNTGIPLTTSLKRSGHHWYEMRDTNTADFVTTMNPDQRLFFSKFEEPSFINQRLIGMKSKESENSEVVHALLNSILGMFYIEAVGFGRGLGALDVSADSFKSAYMLNPDILSDSQKNSILDAFAPLLEREILSTTEEMQSNDRTNFDKIVLREYGIEKYHDEIKSSLLSMQKLRLTVKD